MQIREIDPRHRFLLAAEAPPNLLRLRPGEKLRWKGEVRKVIRVGYRKTAVDYLDEARKLLDGEAARGAVYLLSRLGEPVVTTKLFERPGLRLRGLDWTVARALAERDGLGGPERGIWLNEKPYTVDYSATPVEVLSTRVVRLGDYFPPCGYGEDFESGGLANVRSVVLVQSDIGEVLSGDLERIPSAPPEDDGNDGRPSRTPV